MRRGLVVANWKMHGSIIFNRKLVEEIIDGLAVNMKELADIVICPPNVYLQSIKDILNSSNISIGAQDVYYMPKGPYTGAVAPQMLADVGCDWVILGHSERRQHFAENDNLIAKKFQAVIDSNLKPILCVGENQQQHQHGQTLPVVLNQLNRALEKVKTISQNTVIAYEPIWAIGTGDTASPIDAQNVHMAIRDELAKTNKSIAQSVRIIYGGSVKPNNIDNLLNMPDIDGVLVGGASLDSKHFVKICHSYLNLK